MPPMPPNARSSSSSNNNKASIYGAISANRTASDVEAILEEGTDTTSGSSAESMALLDDNDKSNTKTICSTSFKEKPTYDLTFAFQLMSGFVSCSMSIWGVWIAIFYGKAALYDWDQFNIVFPDLYTPEYPVASFAIAFHLIGAAFMAFAGAFQLIKYIRKVHPVFHRWVGRLYILSSLIASISALIFIFNKGTCLQCDFAS
jgi:Predicted membrane protein (DUF2306)